MYRMLFTVYWSWMLAVLRFVFLSTDLLILIFSSDNNKRLLIPNNSDNRPQYNLVIITKPCRCGKEKSER